MAEFSSRKQAAKIELIYERVKFICGHSAYEAEREPLLKLSHGGAVRLKRHIRDHGITLEEVQSLTPTDLYAKYFKATEYMASNGSADSAKEQYLQPDYAELSRELMRSMDHSGGSTNIKLELQRRTLYEDVYCSEENRKRCAQQNLKFYSLTHFYRLWRRFEKSSTPPSFRRTDPPGAIAEFDFTGVTMYCADGTKACFAVMVLNYSRRVYVEAVPSQNATDSATAIINGFRYMGGVTETLRVDNFKAAISRPGRYGGEATQLYRTLANFFGFRLSSMPPRSGWLKGAAEAAVKITTHTLIARMKRKERNEGRFRNIAEMNLWLRQNLDLINNHAVRALKCTRNMLFEQEERQALRKVQSWDFRLSEIKTYTVGSTSRLTINDHQYAVPTDLINHKVQVELRQQKVVIYQSGRPVCIYSRLDGVAGLSTKPGYTPQSHLFVEVLRAIPNALYLEWAQAIGPETLNRVKKLLHGQPNIDKFRRAAKFLQLPRENPDCYPVFEHFLKEQSPETGVSRLAELWKQYPNKPDNSKKDPVYSFDRLFKKVEARLYGKESDLNWDPAGDERPLQHPKGVVFLNYHTERHDKSNDSIIRSDPVATTTSDPTADTVHDPNPNTANDPVKGHELTSNSHNQELT